MRPPLRWGTYVVERFPTRTQGRIIYIRTQAASQVFASRGFVVEEGSIQREANLQSLSATVAWVLPLIQLTALTPNPHPTHHTHHTIHTTPHTHTHRVREPAKSCSIPHHWAATGTLECPAPITTCRRRRRRCPMLSAHFASAAQLETSTTHSSEAALERRPKFVRLTQAAMCSDEFIYTHSDSPRYVARLRYAKSAHRRLGRVDSNNDGSTHRRLR